MRKKKNACFFLLFCQVCKYYLCGFCPAELFTNTRSDLGKSISLVIFIHLYVITIELLLQTTLLLFIALSKHFENRLYFFKGLPVIQYVKSNIYSRSYYF